MAEIEWRCELCGELIEEGQPHIRISADTAVRKKRDFFSLNNDEILVFAIFHSECVLETLHDELVEDTPYIWEARSYMELADLCEDCKAKIDGSLGVETEKPKSRDHLTLLPGGRK